MVSRSGLLLRLPLGRWLLGMLLVLVAGSGWACAEPAAAAGPRIARPAAHPAVVQAADAAAHHGLARGAVLQGPAAAGATVVAHPCGHVDAGAAPGSDPCASADSACAGLCATVCLPAAGAGPAVPFTAAGLAASVRGEACPQRRGWAGTGRSVPPESPPPID